VSEPDPGERPYPDAAEFAGHAASLYGLRNIVDVGLAWTPELAVVFPDLRVSGAFGPLETGDAAEPHPAAAPGPHFATEPRSVAAPGPHSAAAGRYRFGRPIDPSDPANSARLARLEPATSALLAAGPAGRLCGEGGALTRLRDLVAASPLVVVATDDPAPVLDLLAGCGRKPEFVGRTRSHPGDAERSGYLVVADERLARLADGPARPPDGFRVVAIVTAYNEEDIIGPAIEKLVGDGVGVYVVDNWSTDRTGEIVRGFEGRGLVGLERFPAAPSESFALRKLLKRIAGIAAGLDADWFIHHDADERRCGPWPGLGLRDSLWRVDRAGFSAVDHTVVNYQPVDDSFEPGSDFEEHFRYFEFGRSSDLLLQVKAWKNVGRVDLAGSAGHQVAFAGRRIFPYKFLLKHYSIRSQAHGEKKVFRERVPRWDRHERVRGWHRHYDAVEPGRSFLRDPRELVEDSGPDTWLRYMPEALTGAGLAQRDLPEWALAGEVGRRAFLARQSVEASRSYKLLVDAVSKPGGLARRVRAGLGSGR
jgi:hypothetical protein